MYSNSLWMLWKLNNWCTRFRLYYHYQTCKCYYTKTFVSLMPSKTNCQFKINKWHWGNSDILAAMDLYIQISRIVWKDLILNSESARRWIRRSYWGESGQSRQIQRALGLAVSALHRSFVPHTLISHLAWGFTSGGYLLIKQVRKLKYVTSIKFYQGC